MSSLDIVLKLRESFQSGERFKMPALKGKQLKEFLAIMEWK